MYLVQLIRDRTTSSKHLRTPTGQSTSCTSKTPSARTPELCSNLSFTTTGSVSLRRPPILHFVYMQLLPVSKRPALISVLENTYNSRWLTRKHRAGYPIATVPLGQLRYNQRPYGLCLMAREGHEEDLIRFMHLYESVTPPRPLPMRLSQS